VLRQFSIVRVVSVMCVVYEEENRGRECVRHTDGFLVVGSYVLYPETITLTVILSSKIYYL
jgi:hypothetical protein